MKESISALLDNTECILVAKDGYWFMSDLKNKVGAFLSDGQSFNDVCSDPGMFLFANEWTEVKEKAKAMNILIGLYDDIDNPILFKKLIDDLESIKTENKSISREKEHKELLELYDKLTDEARDIVIRLCKRLAN